MEKPRPTKEEMLEIDRKAIERSDALPEIIIEDDASRILQDLDLTLEDLRGNVVLDIGAGPSIIERAAKQQGIDTVLSLERKSSRMSKKPDLNRVNADARAIPFNNGSIDLLISHNAPPGIPLNTTEHDSLVILQEFQRVLSDVGEARIAPANLAFIVEKDKRYRELREKMIGNEELSGQEKDELRQHIVALTKQSTQFLLAKGFNVEIVKKDEEIKSIRQIFFNQYWKLRKNQKS